MQVSPSGMAAASQAASGEFDSRHLLQKIPIEWRSGFFIYSLRFSLSANAEENLSIFRHLLHCLKHLIDFRCFYLQIQLFAKSLSLFAFSRNG